MTVERFYCPEIGQPGEDAVLPPEERHHLRHVLRIRDGARVCLVNGAGVTGHASVHFPDRQTVRVTIADRQAWAPPLSRVTLALAFPEHRDVLTDVIRGVVELGVSDIELIHTRYCGFKRSGDIDKILDRCRRIIRHASQQCGRVWFPRVSGITRLAPFLAGTPPDMAIYCGWEPEAGGTVISIGDIPIHSGDFVWLVGPEGGWSGPERQLMQQNKICKVRLGGLTLTTRMAATAGLSALLTRLERW